MCWSAILKGLSGFRNCKESTCFTTYYICGNLPMLMMCINAWLALYFERNSRLNVARIVLGYAKPVLRSPFLPTSLVHLSRKVSELETMADDNCWRI